jgi:hypothetical protein
MQSLAPVREQALALSRSLERPFYFILVVWGERFRNYFLDLGLPTLLSPGNLPALRTRQRSKFLICTPPEDWTALQAAPIFHLLGQYVDVVHIEIPHCPSVVSGCVHMGIGHRRGCELAYRDKAYPFVLTPDCIFSDGTIARLQELAQQGVELALVPALRFAEEPLFAQLQQSGISPHGRNGMAAPIILKSRDLVRMALASLHSETASYEWDAPYFAPLPSAAWWRVPGEDGIVVHSLSWAAPLFDLSTVLEHDTSTFDEWTYDGDYIYRNLGNIKRAHLVLDSDEMFMASWAPLADKPYNINPRLLLRTPLLGSFLKKQRFNDAFYSGIFDPIKQRIFFHSIRWHSKPLNEKWEHIESCALNTLLSCVAPPPEKGEQCQWDQVGPGNYQLAGDRRTIELSPFARTKNALTLAFFNKIAVPIFRATGVAHSCWVHREAIIPRLRQIAHGDPAVIRWINWRIRQLAYRLLGRTLYEPKPPRPSR